MKKGGFPGTVTLKINPATYSNLPKLTLLYVVQFQINAAAPFCHQFIPATDNYFLILKLLFNDTIRLNIGIPSLESLLSTQKNPLRTNWKRSYTFASFKSGSI